VAITGIVEGKSESSCFQRIVIALDIDDVKKRPSFQKAERFRPYDTF
jgi:hypothetical protein